MQQPRTIRGRMLRALAVPLVTVLGLLVFIAISEVRIYREAVAVTEAVRLNLAVEDLIHELQRERGLTAGLLGGETPYRSDVDIQRPRTDVARAGLDTLVRDDTIPGAVPTRTALALLHDLSAVRGAVDARSADRSSTFDYYTKAIESLGGLAIGADEANDRVLRRSLIALQAVGDAKEASAKERGFLNGVIAQGRFTEHEYAEYVEYHAIKEAARKQFARYATDDQKAREGAVWTSESAELAHEYEETALESADGRRFVIDSRPWWDAMTVLVDDLHGVQRSIGVDAENRAADLRREAATGLIVLVVLALLAGLAVTGEAVLLVSSAQSITEPLAHLAREAKDVATRRLPEAVARIQTGPDAQPPPSPITVPARSAAEIRTVAEAFDQIQQVAHRLAVEQTVVRRNTTESLANLGHRNQNLLRRQLGFISQLEREESDPTALANLFELDHLATRMRRNAESLLALVGESSPRRWSTPLPVADVIRAAIAEVEDYRRVELRRIDNGYVTGASVSDLAHMIAELIENGLAFSPPELNVEIFGQWTGTRYLIAILDQGVGMTEADLARANARLREEESFLLGPARFLGHYVVGRLASELGVTVQLANSPVTGITARLILPPSVVSASADQSPPELEGSLSGQDGATLTRLEPAHDDPTNTATTLESDPKWDAPAMVSPERPEWPPCTPTLGPARTRSGLIKRARPSPETATDKPPEPAPRTDAPAAIDRQPAEVRTMLSAFRAGTERGEARSTAPGSTAQVHEKGSQ